MTWVIKRILIVIFLSVLIPAPLLCQEDLYENKAVITYKGKTGYFFDEETGDKILRDLISYKKLQEKIVLLETKIKLQEYDLTLHVKMIEYSEFQFSKCEIALEDSEVLRERETQDLRKQLERKLAWYKHPAVSFIVGTIAGGALAVGLSFGLQEAR